MSVKLPPAFQLSQSSLQDFADCARRFQLRYLMEQEWPAPPAEALADAERADILGKHFHLLVERYWLGVPLDEGAISPALLPWWAAFLRGPACGLPMGEPLAEISRDGVWPRDIHGSETAR